MFAGLSQSVSPFHVGGELTGKNVPSPSHGSSSSVSVPKKKDPYFWNTTIRTYIERNLYEDALRLYKRMVADGVEPDDYTFPLALKACYSIPALKEGRQIHTHIAKNASLAENVFVHNGLLQLYCCSGCSDDARQLFDRMPHRSPVSWNTMIAGYSRIYQQTWLPVVKNGNCADAVLLYCLMIEEGIRADNFTFTALLRACGSCLGFQEGIQIHCHAIKLGLETDVYVRNTLIDMYGKFGQIQNARLLFDGFPERDLVSWNALLTGFVRLGDIESAESLFAEMDERDIVSWNAMMTGYLQRGRANEVLDVFRQTQVAGVCPNIVSVVTAISACSLLGTLSLGVWFHIYSLRHGFESNEYVSSSLVKMYAKCGDIENAVRLFDKMPQRDVVSWDVMIEGLALHGRAKDALALFRRMKNEGVNPDDITFIGVLSACSHAGLIEEGFLHFDSMTKEYGIEPRVEHYACLVDLLGRAGRLHDALQIVESMPIAPDSVVWSALLSACRIHGSIELAEKVAKTTLEMEPSIAANYILLSNVYAASSKWEEVASVRTLMKLKGLDKEPGCSVLEMDGSIHEFVAGDNSHPQLREVNQMLDKLAKRLKEAGYEPHKEVVLRDIEEEVKETVLYGHSEKLAVAFALINSAPGTPIRVVKNLRICSDCHSAIKLISKIEAREIVVRDRNRFHHFIDGSCSCGDYW
ncbi:Pentatricopeptide repeat-containing protein [Nymphaea thermarum]|nr:Pentatricopeptide repeat-containing protein [Nymphaea thermarum]